jgi:4-alpha-glucanotransferase
VGVTQHDDLRRRAQAHGVAVSYQDWRGRELSVSDETLARVLEALGDSGSATSGSATSDAATATAVAPYPAGRSWGFMAQLYSVRSRASWGHGDFHDLADLATWSARELGADFVLVNPLHAAEPLPPISPSPYLPMSRHYLSPLYLRVEDIPEYARLSDADRARIDALAAPLRAADSSASLIDRDTVWTAKRAALELIRKAVPLDAARQADFDAFKVREGKTLAHWAMWCALAEKHGPDWRTWPERLRTPASTWSADLPAGPPADRPDAAAETTEFHAWLQWLATGQEAAAQAAARDAGMSIGVVTDLAVGSHPGGADTWAGQDVFARGVSVGAPPDEFNQRGQDWTLPPWLPGRAAGPLASLVAATMRNAGGLRVDHVMSLSRLWWIPAGLTPDLGTYVRYDHERLGNVLAAGGAAANAVTIGEDLGTVEPWLRGFLAERRILGTSMLWFERDAAGLPLPPGQWRTGCLATVGTHDLPPATAFLTGEEVTIRADLGLLARPEAEERAAAATDLDRFLALLTSEGLLAGHGTPTPADFTVALYAHLARTPAVLIGVSLAEAVGERRPQNIPGTTDQYPNWRIPLADGTGRPVLLEDLPANAGVRAVVGGIRGVSVQHIRGRVHP